MPMDLKNRNIIEESTSPWAFPVVLVATNKRAMAEDVNSIGWRCLGELKHGRNSIIYFVAVPIRSVVAETPLGALTFGTPYELGRLISIMRMSHVPESWKVARMLDNNFDHLSVVGLCIAMAFYNKSVSMYHWPQ
ncbi:hypothetical protein ANCDUO_06535 [Ancylostoma duodenale]|uniref:Uncharacterized protein n=1 Tax=Ancylostoma duodenale TaxID=51022 RepID=A0A0C2H189_9BILA|nr:hypothetical protein ANCDUO_06535 [Ancylostoma duodenale]